MMDKIKAAVAVLLLIAGIAGFYFLSESPMVLRVASVLAGLAAGAAVGWTTEPGKQFYVFPGSGGRDEEGGVADAQGIVPDRGRGLRLRGCDGGVPVGHRQDTRVFDVRRASRMEEVTMT